MRQLMEALRDLDEQKVYQLVEDKIKNDVPVLDIIAELNEGMVAVGNLYADGTYFLSELIYSGEVLTNGMKQLELMLKESKVSSNKGTIIMGTVKGDIHDIGKNIIISLLRGAGFEVIDLGVDVPTEAFAAKVKETGAKIVGLSALLNFTYPEMKNVIDDLVRQGVREGVTIIIGGAPCNEEVREFVGADFYAKDAVAGVNICKSIYK